MRQILSAAVYTALTLVANAAVAQDLAALEALRSGDLRKLAFATDPQPAADFAFLREDGTAAVLADYRGQIVLVNFWATWCAPCRQEMPQLSDLQTALGGADFTVLTIATGRNPAPAMARFMQDIGVDNLPLHTDPDADLSRAMGVLGLPVTIILNRDGQEIARLIGDADWSGESATQIIAALIAG
jgi:thiol-disulfide isomerase/thioredoxin